jgi:uncharacterized Fe-S cluster protein YjdI
MSHKPSADREELAISHARPYTAPSVRVFYDRGRCLHFAECVRGLPQVFDVQKRPWIQPENASAEEVAEVVRRCPSGALHYRLEEGPSEEPEHPTRVEFVAEGPINLRGDLSIEVPAGRMREVRASQGRASCSWAGSPTERSLSSTDRTWTDGPRQSTSPPRGRTHLGQVALSRRGPGTDRSDWVGLIPSGHLPRECVEDEFSEIGLQRQRRQHIL